jgi:TRAP transporter TAXI family solute receptor
MIFPTAAQLAGTQDVRFGAMPIGSSWYVYAASFSKILERALPPGSTVEVVPQGGGIANPLTVSQGKAEVALANVATCRWAFDGIEMYNGRKSTNIRALAGGLNQVFVVVIFSKDFIAKTGIDSIQKIADRKYPVRFITKTEGSTAPPAARMIFAQYGMSFDTIKQWGGQVIQVSGGQIPSMMREGRADLWIDVVPPNHPAVSEGMLTANLTIVPLEEKTIQALGARGLYGDTIPPGSFPTQGKPIRTVNPGTVIIVNESMPDNLAYLLTRTICESKDELVAANPSLAPFVPQDAWKPENTGIPLHPGAIRYYKEKGWMK